MISEKMLQKKELLNRFQKTCRVGSIPRRHGNARDGFVERSPEGVVREI